MAALQSHLTNRLVQINLEIIYLLTGENYGPIKKEPDEEVTPSNSIRMEEESQKILELANNIIELVTNGKEATTENPPSLTSLGSQYGVSHQSKPQEGNTAHSMGTISCKDEKSSPCLDITMNDPLKYIQIKEETQTFGEEHLPHLNISTPRHCIQSTSPKEELHPAGEEYIPPPHISTPTHYMQPSPTRNKEEPYSFGETHTFHLGISEPAGHTQSTSTHIKKESHSIGEEHFLPTEKAIPPHTRTFHLNEEPQLFCEKPILHPLIALPTHKKEELLPHKERQFLQHVDINSPENEIPQPSSGFNKERDRGEGERPPQNRSVDANGTSQSGQPGKLGQKPYFCTECGKRFRYNTWFVSHQKTHIPKPPYCSECDQTFSTTEELKKHQRAHNAPKVYCSQCGKFFPTTTDLRHHELTHPKRSSYICPDCGMCFFSNANLRKHQRVHRGEAVYQCPQCEKCFTHAHRLHRHQRLHTGERLFTCTDCERSFVDRCDLVKHMRIHTGERPFFCLECGSSFYNSSNFLRHQRTHTKNKSRTSCNV